MSSTQSSIPTGPNLLTLLRLPARLTKEQTAYLLGFQAHDIRILVSCKLLKPLGQPTQGAPKWFATAQIEQLRCDLKFLDKATQAVSRHWKQRNARGHEPEPLD